MGAQGVHSDGDDAVMRDLRQQVRTTLPLQAGEQERLLARIALGDRASQDRLVATNLAMVIRMGEARRERGLSVSDLVLEGSLGFLEAMNTFVQSKSADFIAFAERKVGDRIDSAIASEAAPVRDGALLVAAATHYGPTAPLLARVLRRPPMEAEIEET